MMKRIAGVFIFLPGLSIFAWIGCHLLQPVEGFEFGIGKAIKLIIPSLCLITGWKWMRSAETEPEPGQRRPHLP